MAHVCINDSSYHWYTLVSFSCPWTVWPWLCHTLINEKEKAPWSRNYLGKKRKKILLPVDSAVFYRLKMPVADEPRGIWNVRYHFRWFGTCLNLLFLGWRCLGNFVLVKSAVCTLLANFTALLGHKVTCFPTFPRTWAEQNQREKTTRWASPADTSLGRQHQIDFKNKAKFQFFFFYFFLLLFPKSSTSTSHIITFNHVLYC